MEIIAEQSARLQAEIEHHFACYGRLIYSGGSRMNPHADAIATKTAELDLLRSLGNVIHNRLAISAFASGIVTEGLGLCGLVGGKP